jgi:23S rRNA pseudouridine1911/1915/1917 synthase
MPVPICLLVSEGEAPSRLDSFLSPVLSYLSRRAIHELINTGQVLINGRRGKKGQRLSAGDEVLIQPPTPYLQPNPSLPVCLLHTDEDLVILDKPADIPSHALRYSEINTTANFLVAHFPELALVGKSPLEAGLVHRLDTTTSGLLTAARNPQAYAFLRRQFTQQKVYKEYLALVEGRITQAGDITLPLLSSGQHKSKVLPVSTGQGKAAITYYTPLETFSGFTLLRVTINTGVRHQIRGHLAAVGHPVAGDFLYGNPTRSFPRLFLHAARLEFRHPRSRQKFLFASPPPAELQEVVGALQSGTVDEQ